MPALEDGEVVDEQTLVRADGLDLCCRPVSLARGGGPVVERLVQLGDGAVLDLRPLLAEPVDDGGQLLLCALLSAGRSGYKGCRQD